MLIQICMLIIISICLIMYEYKRYQSKDLLFFLGGMLISGLYVLSAILKLEIISFAALMATLLKPLKEPVKKWLAKYRM
ncbi:hypothetical protein SAMN04488134_1084 [Amphibacillus marinus]|uniref:Uncharacterized protein n=1 Tax=Amphibacillus marinus TaxID=872970 RepID=A0A1H8Q1K3_9BACI|nr:hypothetical protein [Amphibacillus marinus]SEO47878.1 hypothetical protein SAMN04488134_1084 [Amphibacillus marinus]